MPRPGFVLEVDDRTPSLLTLAGADLKLHRFGVGTQVIYPADAVASSEPVALIASALNSPIDAPPLSQQLRPDTTLTIVVLGVDSPQPRPEFDVRQTLVERVLETAARAHVDDVEIVIANGLAKRWSAQEISQVLGDRVATSFLPDGLVTSHDATADDLVAIGEIEGQPVLLNRRVAQSDLVVVIGASASLSGCCPLVSGLTDVTTINKVLGLGATDQTRSAIAEVVRSAITTFGLVAVLGQPYLSPGLRFIGKREWEWKIADRLAFAAARQVVAALPRQGAQLVHGSPKADYPILDVLGGEFGTTYSEASLVWRAAHAVQISRQADVLVTPIWGASIDAYDPIGSPLEAAYYGLVQRAGSYLDRPLVRDGGAMIALHPLRARFSNRRQAAAADFFAKVLPETTNVDEIAATYEPAALADQWYLDLYRKNFADHPLRVFHQWYQISAATSRFSNVIWVGGDRRNAALLGHRSATSYADALEIASNVVGTQPTISVMHGIGAVVGELR